MNHSYGAFLGCFFHISFTISIQAIHPLLSEASLTVFDSMKAVFVTLHHHLLAEELCGNEIPCM